MLIKRPKTSKLPINRPTREGRFCSFAYLFKKMLFVSDDVVVIHLKLNFLVIHGNFKLGKVDRPGLHQFIDFFSKEKKISLSKYILFLSRIEILLGRLLDLIILKSSMIFFHYRFTKVAGGYFWLALGTLWVN